MRLNEVSGETFRMLILEFNYPVRLVYLVWVRRHLHLQRQQLERQVHM